MTWSCEGVIPAVRRLLRNNGFTLLEVLVALAIAGLALAVLSDATSGGVLAGHTAAAYEEAVSRAKSHLAALAAGEMPAAGVGEGDDGGGYRWRYRVREVARHQGSGGLALYEIEVGIAWGSGGQRRDVVLSSQRTARGGPNG